MCRGGRGECVGVYSQCLTSENMSPGGDTMGMRKDGEERERGKMGRRGRGRSMEERMRKERDIHTNR